AAANVHVDSAGMVLNSVVVTDDRYGESELAELLLPAAQPLAAPNLVPAGVATLSVGRASLQGYVAWLDSWLAAAAPYLADDLNLRSDEAASWSGSVDVRSLARSQLGLNLDTALLDWVGSSWQAATFEEPVTDLVPYLTGQRGVLIVPVTSEAAARRGLPELA